MRAKIRAISAGLAALILIAVVLAATRSKEPAYGGKRLGEWLGSVPSTSELTRQQFETAIREIGTNSIPYLRKMLAAEDSHLKITLARLLARQNMIKVKIPMAQDKRLRATLACSALGPSAAPLIPDLLGLVENGRGPYNSVMWALSRMDEVAVEPLVLALTNSNVALREMASGSLGYMGPPASNAIPNLLASLKDPDPGVRINSSLSLGKIGIGSADVVEELAKCLSDPDPAVLCNAADSLSRFGPKAVLALPALRSALTNEHQDARNGARFAIDKIEKALPH